MNSPYLLSNYLPLNLFLFFLRKIKVAIGNAETIMSIKIEKHESKPSPNVLKTSD
jgi:hypothetical protein